MNKVYSIVISKRGVKTPEVATLLKKIFKYTWGLAINKHNETWLCGREEEVNISDLVSSIQGLNKKIDGVFITKVIITAACYDNNGCFYEDEYVGRDGVYHPGSVEMLKILMNKE